LLLAPREIFIAEENQELRAPFQPLPTTISSVAIYVFGKEFSLTLFGLHQAGALGVKYSQAEQTS
jgi:hypothetical protein